MANPVFRRLDPDAIARVAAGIRYKPEPLRRQKERRMAQSYRAVRRNARRMKG